MMFAYGTEYTLSNLSKMRRSDMKKYRCVPCDYIYDPLLGDPENLIAPGTAFDDLPDDWVCPECYVGKEEFVPVDE